MSDYPSSFPAAFTEYCAANGIPPETFHDIPWDTIHSTRYIRLRRNAITSTLMLDNAAKVKESLELPRVGGDAIPARRVMWLPSHAYWIPRGIPIAQCVAFQQGDVCPMDAASMAAVVALQVCRGDRVLDLCCCPGMKLLMIADALRMCDTSAGDTPHQQPLIGSVVGVDVHMDRLLVARSLVRKYHSEDLISLVCCDGTQYDPAALIAQAQQASSMESDAVEERLRRYRKFQERQRKRRRTSDNDTAAATTAGGDAVSPGQWVLYSKQEAVHATSCAGIHDTSTSCDDKALFDKVLVDVECTHDGSVLHLDMAGSDNPITSAKTGGITNAMRMERMNYTTADDASHLFELQLALLLRGYALLKPGGRLVYSTCSFSEKQNELIVEKFLLAVHKHAVGILCVPEVPFPIAPAPSACGGSNLSSLLAIDEATKAKADEVVTYSTRALDIPLAGNSTTRVEVTTARLWPKKSLTSFQFVAALRKL